MKTIEEIKAEIDRLYECGDTIDVVSTRDTLEWVIGVANELPA